ISLPLSGLTSGKNYDVFAFPSSPTAAALELSAAWTNNTTRADALTTLNGVLVKSSDNSRRYIGTIRATGTTTTADDLTHRFVWNFYNRVHRDLLVADTTANWTYANATVRQANGSSSNKVEVVCGEPVLIKASIHAMYHQHSGTALVGIGVDSTTT